MSCPHCAPRGTGACPVPLTLSEGPRPQVGECPPGVEPTVLLVGNPNVGKSTIFNALTGARQAVVNAPGTTVEVMQGRWSALGVRLLDLPGTYSLIANSPDEQVVVDTLAGVPGSLTDPAQGRGVDLVLVVLDATAMSRSLYLLGQVARTGRPVAALVTLADVVAHEGQEVDASALSSALGVPVMVVDPRSAKGLTGVDEMVRAALCSRPRVRGIEPDPAAPGFSRLAARAAAQRTAPDPAVGLEVIEARPGCGCGCGCAGQVDSTAAAMLAVARGDDPLAAADGIFAWVEGIEERAFGQEASGSVPSRSDRIDRVLLHPLVGIPVFFALMWLLFKIAGEWVGPLQDLFEGIFASTDPGAASLANLFHAGLALVGWEHSWVHGLLVGGLCTGFGVVASFLPLMFVIFFLISVLEDSGYMARAAFLGDRVMRAIGLDGRVIMPLIMGFGCNLPALAATRALPNARQRLVAILVIPYTSCAARLTIYLMIARIFFPENTGTVLFALYVLSLLIVVLGALVLRPLVNRGASQAPLMLVLPAYQMPRPLMTMKTAALRAWSFVRGAGRIIVVMTLVVWLMSAIPVVGGHSFAEEGLPMEDSLYGRTAQVLVPAFAPTGFGEWHMTGALMTGFVAKETVISSIVTSYNLDPETAGGDAEEGGADLGALPRLVHASFEESAGDAAPVAALAFLIFVLTYTPCLATMAEQARQIGLRWAALAVLVQLAVAWCLAVAVFQIGRLWL